MKWKGVIPAMTSCFKSGSQIDHAFMTGHSQWLVENGCTGVVVLGSLGEGATLTFDEKAAVMANCAKALKGRGSVVAAISSLTTAESVSLAKAAHAAGCDGLMVLPPYVYKGDWREMKAHVAAVFQATPLPCLYAASTLGRPSTIAPTRSNAPSR